MAPPPRPLIACAAGAALGLVAGAHLWLLTEMAGGRPETLILATAAFALAFGLGRAPTPRPGRRGARGLGLWLAAALIPLADRAGPALWFPAVVATGAAWGWVLRPIALRPLALMFAGPSLLIGLIAPLPALIAACAGGLALDLRPEPHRSPPPLREDRVLRAPFGAALLLALASAAVVGAWSAGRTHHDPSVGGTALFASCALLLAGLAARAAFTRWAAVLVAAAVLLTPLLVGAVALRGQPLLAEMAGSEDPRRLLTALLIAPAVPAMLAAGPPIRALLAQRSWAAVAAVAVGGGALLGLETGPALPGYCLAFGGIAAALGVLTQPGLPRLASVLAGAAAIALLVQPPGWPETELPRGQATLLRSPLDLGEDQRLRASLRPAFGGWGPGGGTLVEIRDERLARVHVDGLPITLDSRAADAERLAGHLATALVPSATRAVVLGDELGLVTEGLLMQEVERIRVSVPDVAALRGLALVHPPLAQVFLDPSVTLVPGSAERPLYDGTVDVIVEVARLPWRDARQAIPGERGLKRRARSLGDGGAYLLVVPLAWLEEADLRRLLADFDAAFDQTQVFLPPQGGDQVLIAGWRGGSLASWGSVTQAATRGLSGLTGLAIRTPLDLADRGIVGDDGVRALARPGRPSPWLPPVLHRRPRMLLPIFLPHVEAGTSWLAVDEPRYVDGLEQRVATNRAFIELLENTASGKLDEVFASSRSLLDESGGARSLDPLVAPHIERARQHIARGTEEGPGSSAWTDCLQETRTALLINPRSPQANALAGKCQLATRDLDRAKASFDKALEESPGELEALLGLAQLSVRDGRLTEAEQHLRSATLFNPRSWRAQYHLGVFLMDLDRLEEAQDLLEKAKAQDESELPLGALAHLHLRKGDPNAALSYAELAVSSNPSARNLHIRGLAYYELSQLEVAAHDFRKAVLADANYWPAHADLGRVLARDGDFVAAADSFKRALDLDPGNAAIQRNLDQAKALVEYEEKGQPQ